MMLIDEVWIIEGIKDGKVRFSIIRHYKSLAEIEYTNLIIQNLRTHEYDSIELISQNTKTNEILGRKVRTFR